MSVLLFFIEISVVVLFTPLSFCAERIDSIGRQGERFGVDQGLDINVTSAIRRCSVSSLEGEFTNPDEIFACLYGLSQKFYKDGEFDSAILIFNEIIRNFSKDEFKRVYFGFEHLVYFYLARCYHRQFRFLDAEYFYKKSIDATVNKFGENSYDLVEIYLFSGLLGIDSHEYKKASNYFDRCIRLIRDYGDKHHIEHVVLQHMANLEIKRGGYSKAKNLLERAVDLATKQFGEKSQPVAQHLAALGQLFIVTGEYGSASVVCSQAQEMSGADQFLPGLICLGDLHQVTGDFSKSEQFYLQASQGISSESQDYSLVLLKLAQLAYLNEEYKKALAYYGQARTALQVATKGESPRLVPILHDIALCHWRTGHVGEAEVLLGEALHLAEKYYGKDAPDVIFPLNNLSRLFLHNGDVTKAARAVNRSLGVAEKTFGADHPELCGSLYVSSILHFMQQDYKTAWQLLLRINHLDNRLIDEVFRFASESEKLTYLSRTHRHLNLTLRTLIPLAATKNAVRDGYNVWLHRKGLVLESQKTLQEIILRGDDKVVAEIFSNLSKVRTDLSNILLSAPGKGELDTYRQRIAVLESQKDQLESKLASLSQSFAQQVSRSKVDVAGISKSLPQHSVLIDFVRLDAARTDFDRICAASRCSSGARYLAFILPAGGQPVLVDLGEANLIEKILAELKSVMHSREVLPSDPLSAQIVKGHAASLYRHLFKPLRSHLGNRRNVYLSPDGALNLLPFEILCDESERFLVEEFTFNYIASGKELLRTQGILNGSGKNLIMGNPDYNLDETTKDSVVRQLKLPHGLNSVRHVRSRGLRDFRFSALPGTQQEVEAIRDVLGTESSEFFLGKEALEDVLSSRVAPRILHLATHGFYLSDQDLPATHDLDATPMNREGGRGATRSILFENPLVRSGIALAGANSSVESSGARASDGLVTAEKILNLNLVGTELVVLSACESGLGDVKSGEGVFGLRRAFSQAGAKGLVMSMWSVPDEETKELMTHFYTNLQSGSVDRAQALRQAMLSEMSTVKKRYGHDNPFFWGAFVFAGER